MVPDLPYSMFSVLLMFFVFFIKRAEYASSKWLYPPQMRWAYGICAGYWIVSLYAAIPDAHSEATINLFKLIIIISVAYKLINTGEKLDIVLKAYVGGAAYIGFVAFQTGRNSGDRVEGIGTVDAPNANSVAAAIAPSLVFALYYFWSSKSKATKMMIAVFGVFIANAIVLINSRGSFLASIAGLTYFMLHMMFSKFRVQNQRKTAYGLIFLGVVGLANIVDEGAINRFTSMQETEMKEEEETEATRLFFWLAAIEVAKDNPFGLGYKGFNAVSHNYIPETVDTGGSRNRSVHSTWFQSLTELGYFGIIALVLMLYTSFYSTKKAKRDIVQSGDRILYYKLTAIQASLLTFMISMTFTNRFTAEILYWLVMFSACAYNIYANKESEDENEVKNPSMVK